MSEPVRVDGVREIGDLRLPISGLHVKAQGPDMGLGGPKSSYARSLRIDVGDRRDIAVLHVEMGDGTHRAFSIAELHVVTAEELAPLEAPLAADFVDSRVEAHQIVDAATDAAFENAL